MRPPGARSGTVDVVAPSLPAGAGLGDGQPGEVEPVRAARAGVGVGAEGGGVRGDRRPDEGPQRRERSRGRSTTGGGRPRRRPPSPTVRRARCSPGSGGSRPPAPPRPTDGDAVTSSILRRYAPPIDGHASHGRDRAPRRSPTWCCSAPWSTSPWASAVLGVVRAWCTGRRIGLFELRRAVRDERGGRAACSSLMVDDGFGQLHVAYLCVFVTLPILGVAVVWSPRWSRPCAPPLGRGRRRRARCCSAPSASTPPTSSPAGSAPSG